MTYNEPIWTQNGRAIRQYPWQDGDAKADVCIIGGGLTGVLSALRLTRAGRSVVLLTRKPIGYGVTSRLMSCGLCSGGQGLRALARRVGRERAVRVLELMYRSAEELEKLCSQLNGEAGFSRRDCVVYADSEPDADQLRREFGEYRKAGFSCSLMNRSAFGSAFAFPAAAAMMLRGGAVEVNPYLLAQWAAAEAADGGAIIFENTRAERISAASDGRMCITSSTRRKVTAENVVVAAGSACSEILAGISYSRTRYIAVSRPVRAFRGWPGRCVVQSWGEPGIICSASPDERMVISCCASAAAESRERIRGALHLSGSDTRRYEELKAAAHYLFPETDTAKFDAGWTCRGIRTADGLPVIGRTREQPGCIFAAGGGEGGAVSAMLAARIIADELTGEQPEELTLFSPERRRLAG